MRQTYLGEKANFFKPDYHPRGYVCRCGGYMEGRSRALPGEICQPAMCYRRREALGWVGRSQQRPYESE